MFPLHGPIPDEVREELKDHPDLTAALLSRRGIVTREHATTFLNPSYDEHLHDPLLILDMEKAATRLVRAILEKEKVVVWSDYDCDGIPGAVVLHDFLKKVGASFENYIPHRHLEGYGVNRTGIETLAQSGATLIVTVDSGITDTEAIARARELGMDVIVTDHHLPGSTLPPAFAIVNPNARENETYPFRSLCGAGVAWKLVCATLALSPELRTRVHPGWEKWLLDMVGLATIADMVPLVGENRVLATYGLKVLRKSRRPGLVALCRVMRSKQSLLTEDDVAFMVAPRVNAASRIGDAKEAFALFTTADPSEAELLAKKLESYNRTRRAEAGAITRAAHARLKEKPVREVIVLGDPEWRPALLGLVATTIAEEYERPVFLWGREGTEGLKGSVRSGDGTHVLELMRAAGQVFSNFGGHAAAGGFTVHDSRIFDLEEALVNAYTLRSTSPTEITMCADARLSPHEITHSFLRDIERLAPFGIENPKPVFLLAQVPLVSISSFGKKGEHLKLSIETARAPLDAVAFFAKPPLMRLTQSLTPGSLVTLLAHLERDTFQGANALRLRLVDLKRA